MFSTEPSKANTTERTSCHLATATIKLALHLSVVLFFSELSPAVKLNLMFILVPCLACILSLFFLTASHSVVLGSLNASATEMFLFLHLTCNGNGGFLCLFLCFYL